MKLRYGVSPAAIELIKRFEGFQRTAVPTADGGWTVGYGHTRSARAGAEVSEADAEALLGYDLVDIQAAVNDWTFTPLTQNQFDALVSFVFNIGLEAFSHSSVLRRVNEGALLQAACSMEMWRKAEFDGEIIIVDALIRRRAAERALFLTPPEGFVPAPSAILRPQLDYAARGAVPRVTPTELATDPVSGTASPVASPPAPEPTAQSPSERAAAEISARLQAIWPDEPVQAPVADVEPDPFPAAVTEPIAEPPETPFPPHAQGPEPDPPVRPMPLTAGIASMRAIFEDTREEPDQLSAAPLVILLALGVVLFGGGLFWMFNAHGGGLLGQTGVGLASGLIGLLCIAGAVYFFLDRLADRD
jgi:lysozyme